MVPSTCYVRHAAGYLLVKPLTRAECFSSNELIDYACTEKGALDSQSGEEELLNRLEDCFQSWSGRRVKRECRGITRRCIV
jgi:hypothetical protein